MIKKIYKKIFAEKTRNNIKEFTQKLISTFYLGDKFYCNCCNKTFRKFLKKGNKIRLNAQCPFCFSLERTRVLNLYICNELNIYNQQNIKILHFAPEIALYRKLNKIKNIEYVDADINPSYARNVIDITKIPFAENYFDYIICSHVLGHVQNEQLAIKELTRVLKPNGLALIMTLISDNQLTYEDDKVVLPQAKLNIYGEADLCRLHGKDFAKRLSLNGFIVNAIDYRLNFSTEFQNKYALGNGEREIIFKCVK